MIPHRQQMLKEWGERALWWAATPVREENPHFCCSAALLGVLVSFNSRQMKLMDIRANHSFIEDSQSAVILDEKETKENLHTITLDLNENQFLKSFKQSL